VSLISNLAGKSDDTHDQEADCADSFDDDGDGED